MGAAFEFHTGERAVQQRAGEAAVAQRNAAMIADTVVTGARGFIAKQFMVVASSVDAQGRVWSSLLFGAPGFVQADDGRTIFIRVPADARDGGDPLWRNLANGKGVGLLFIETATRRRYRVNGWVQSDSAAGITVGVAEAFPNCPQYIQRRHVRQSGMQDGGSQLLDAGGALDGAAAETVRAVLSGADTLFVGSNHAVHGPDASHRGGGAGFAMLLDDGIVRIPDYHGNGMFNTLGNIESDPRAGLLVPDFAGKRLLQLSGRATIRWDQPDPMGLSGGTGRFWDLQVEQWVLRSAPQQAEWEYLDASPFNPAVAGARGAR